MPGLDAVVPALTTARSPLPVQVRMRSDMATYYANNGIIDRALQVTLIRRDAAGVGFMAKTDPSALFEPEPPLERTDDPSLAVGEVSETRELRLNDYGLKHEGSAKYFVLPTFAHWTAGVHAMEVSDTAPLPVFGDVWPPAAPSPRTDALLASAPRSQGLWASFVRSDVPRVEGWLRRPAATPVGHAEPWLTLVAWQPSAHGPVAATCIGLQVQRVGADQLAVFSVPLLMLAPLLPAGPAWIWAASGDFVTAPFQAEFGP
ncbi:MAG: hypothetical protein KF863_07620 [Rubrivivax sp.]|nr:hypothetical protein [Rubrivivax sp.]